MESTEDKERLQIALDKLCSCADNWGMAFNVKKYKVMYVDQKGVVTQRMCTKWMAISCRGVRWRETLE